MRLRIEDDCVERVTARLDADVLPDLLVTVELERETVSEALRDRLIVNSSSASPCVQSLPSTVASAIPKRSGSALASSGM